MLHPELDPSTKHKWLIAIVLIVVGTTYLISQGGQNVTDNQPAASHALFSEGVAGFSQAVRQLQTSGSNSYIPVSIPDYLIPRAHNVFTRSRLYRDRIEFRADPRWRGSENWQILQGLGWLYDEAGTGLVYRFGPLNPCSPMGLAEGKRLQANSRGEVATRVCLEANRLVVDESLYSETTGALTNQMAAGGFVTEVNGEAAF